MRHRETRASRRFGFVRFKSNIAVDDILKRHDEHSIAEKWIDCRRSTRGTSHRPVPREERDSSNDAGKNGSLTWLKTCTAEKRSTRAVRSTRAACTSSARPAAKLTTIATLSWVAKAAAVAVTSKEPASIGESWIRITVSISIIAVMLAWMMRCRPQAGRLCRRSTVRARGNGTVCERPLEVHALRWQQSTAAAVVIATGEEVAMLVNQETTEETEESVDTAGHPVGRPKSDEAQTVGHSVGRHHEGRAGAQDGKGDNRSIGRHFAGKGVGHARQVDPVENVTGEEVTFADVCDDNDIGEEVAFTDLHGEHAATHAARTKPLVSTRSCAILHFVDMQNGVRHARGRKNHFAVTHSADGRFVLPNQT